MSSKNHGINILKCLVQSPKINRDLLKSLGFDNKKFNVIDKPLKKLRDNGLVLSTKIDSTGPGAKPTLNSLNTDINTLKYLVTNVYDNESVLDLMNSKYYHDMIPILIDYLCANTHYELIGQDRKFLSLALKDSPLSLTTILSNELNEKLVDIGKHMDLADFCYMNDGALLKSAIIKTHPKAILGDGNGAYDMVLNFIRQKKEILNRIGADNRKNHYLIYVFNKLYESDLFAGKIPLSDAFYEGRDEMGKILLQCEDSSVYAITPE
ncbi:hypothetical protein HNV12_06710 [Methanococcoides sp. SA1]|nr:hypothetical protein [Methanococcoides sp. SA1]